MISCGWKASTAANIIGIIRLLVRKEIFWSAVINLFFQGFNWLMTLADLFFSYDTTCSRRPRTTFVFLSSRWLAGIRDPDQREGRIKTKKRCAKADAVTFGEKRFLAGFVLRGMGHRVETASGRY
jgi:hypothetical protein